MTKDEKMFKKLQDFLGEGEDKKYRLGSLTNLYMDYCKLIIETTDEKQDHLQIPLGISEQLFYLRELVRILADDSEIHQT